MLLYNMDMSIKKNNHIKITGKIFCCFFAIYAFSSCIREDYGASCNPDVYLRFRYTYNIKQSDAFAYEANQVCVWIFDSNGKLLSQHIDDNKNITDDYSLHIGSLAPGNYTFAAWCRGTKYNDTGSCYNYAEMTPGVSSITDLTARLPLTKDNYYHTQLNSTLNGTLSVDIKNGKQTVMMDLMKCTNTLRIILMPYRAGEQLNHNDFLLYVSDKNSWLHYDASIYKEEPVVYQPYYKTSLYDKQPEEPIANIDEEEINNAIIAEINMSRLFYESRPRLVIRDTKSDSKLLDINLTWLLSLQAVNEHLKEWSAQEYLDRQDVYSIIFFIDDDVLMQNHIVVNGWNVSLENNEL